MLLHWIFVLSGLIQIQKRIQNPLKIDLKILKRKRKGNSLYSFPLSFTFGLFGLVPACGLADNSTPPCLLLLWPAQSFSFCGLA
jgi:hypothetical protein